MKTTLATALSVAGVLVAGSAAALVNTQVLSGDGGSSSGTPEALAPSTLATSTPPAVVPTDAPVLVQPAEAAPSAQQLAFSVGDAGMVTVEVVDGVPTLVGTNLAPGWELVGSSAGSLGELQVVVRSAEVEVTFSVAIVDGQPVTDASARSLVPAATAPSASSGTSGSGGDDSYDDDGHDDDHDDDHDEYDGGEGHDDDD